MGQGSLEPVTYPLYVEYQEERSTPETPPAESCLFAFPRGGKESGAPRSGDWIGFARRSLTPLAMARSGSNHEWFSSRVFSFCFSASRKRVGGPAQRRLDWLREAQPDSARHGSLRLEPRVVLIQVFSFCFSAGRKRVGATGFEPATSCSQNRRTTRLCYAPPKSWTDENSICPLLPASFQAAFSESLSTNGPFDQLSRTSRS